MTLMPCLSVRQPWPWAMFSLSPWAIPGEWHWQLAGARPLPFFPCKGRLGIFKVEFSYSLG